MVKVKKETKIEQIQESPWTNSITISEVFNKKAGEVVKIRGWVYDSRALGKIKFIVIRDMTGRIQVVGFKGGCDEKTFEVMDKISRESVVVIEGKIQDSKQAPGGKELVPLKIEVLGKADITLPIDVSDFSKTELPKRLDYRFLDMHRERIQAIFKVQSTLMQAFREFMIKEGAFEAIFPVIISSSSEGGTDLFKLDYFEKKAFLSQSCQLYKQMVACSMEKVFTIFNVERAEKHNTIRHLNESRQMDFEMAFADNAMVMDVMARCVQYIVKKILEENKIDLERLGVKLKIPEVKYLTFTEVAEIMKKEKIEMGKDDLSGDAERKLGVLYPDTIVFVYDWPLSGKPFYIMPKGKDLSYGFDAIYKGMEITSGGQRIHIPELLIERLKAKGMNPINFEKYIDSFRYGSPPHSGWGMGVERLTMLLLGLENIREAVMFPRDRDRLTP